MVSDEYAVSAVIRWDEHGQVTVLWEMESSTYGFSVAPEIFDQMNIGPVDLEDTSNAPVVLQLLSFDNLFEQKEWEE